MADLPRPDPAGFGNCRRCAYLSAGTPAICFACARQTIEGLHQNRCMTCDLPLAPPESACGNPVCNWPEGDPTDPATDWTRWFLWNYAVAMRSGELLNLINRYKYHDEMILAVIFGRVLIGFLTQEQEIFRKFDLIIGSPTYVGAGARTWDHTRRVLKRAHELSDGTWPFDVEEPATIIKTAATERLTGKSWKQRHAITAGPLRAALTIPLPARTRGKRVLVYDDVFTDGQTLNEVARCLRVVGGAAAVCGVTLSRQPYPR
jgi:predicted amidophosphoribosyltransferase